MQPQRDINESAFLKKKPLRRGGRVAEGGGLLNRYTGNTCIVGSNPISSAIFS